MKPLPSAGKHVTGAKCAKTCNRCQARETYNRCQARKTCNRGQARENVPNRCQARENMQSCQALSQVTSNFGFASDSLKIRTAFLLLVTARGKLLFPTNHHKKVTHTWSSPFYRDKELSETARQRQPGVMKLGKSAAPGVFLYAAAQRSFG